MVGRIHKKTRYRNCDPFGGLGAMQAVHFRLVGKRHIVDFLLVIIQI